MGSQVRAPRDITSSTAQYGSQNSPNGEISATVYSCFEDLADLRADWDAFIEANAADIFLTYDWCRIWWQYYGEGRTLAIYVFRAQNRIVGILPLFSERIWLGPLWADAVKMLGADYTLGQHGFPVERSYLSSALRLLTLSLANSKWDVLFLGNLSGRYAGHEDLRQALRASFDSPRERVTVLKLPHMYFDVAEDFDAYLGTLKKKDRQLMRSTYRKVKGSFRTQLADSQNFAEMFDDFVAAHQAFWRGRGRRGHFGDWPRSHEFHRSVAREQLSHGRLRLLRVSTEDGGEGFQYSYRLGRRYYEVLMGRRLDGKGASVDIGRLLFGEQLRLAIADGVGDIDSMRGIYDYKRRIGGIVTQIHRFCVLRGSVRLAAWRQLARLLDLVYYRAWFCRLSMKLKLGNRKPLNRTWIRTSFLRGWSNGA